METDAVLRGIADVLHSAPLVGSRLREIISVIAQRRLRKPAAGRIESCTCFNLVKWRFPCCLHFSSKSRPP